MMKSQPLAPYDPWDGINLSMTRAERRGLHPAECPPELWPLLLPHQRALLGGLALHVLTTHGPLSSPVGSYARLDYVRARFIEALAATHMREPERGGFGHDLVVYFVSDVEERERWRELHVVVQGKGTLSDMNEILVTISQAGSLEETLLARRAAIDAQLDRMRAGRPGRDAAIRERAARDHERLDGKGGAA